MKMLKYAVVMLLAVAASVAQAQKPESDARFMNITREYQLLPDGSQVYRYAHQLKYLTHRSFHSLYGESFVVYNPEFQTIKVEKSVTTMRDGKRVPSPKNAYNEVLPHFAANAARVNQLKEMVVTHTGLEVGSSVDFAYSVTTAAGVYPGLFDELTLAEDMPVDRYTVVVKVPAGMQLNHQLSRLRLAPAITHEAGTDVYTWSVGATKPVVHESFMPADDEWLPVLRFSTLPSVYAAYDWFVNQPLFTDVALPSSAIDWVAAVKKSEKDEMKVVLKIRDMVSTQMAGLSIPGSVLGYRFNTIAQVWAANAGTQAERTVLLAALLRQAGVNAKPMAVVESALFEHNIGNPDGFDTYVVNIGAADGQPYSITVGQYSNDARYLYPGKMLVSLEPAAESIHKTETGLNTGALKLKGQLKLNSDGSATGDFTFKMLWADNPWFKMVNDDQCFKSELMGIPSKAIKEAKTTRISAGESEVYFKLDAPKLLNEITPEIVTFDIPGFSKGINSWGFTAFPSQRVAPVSFPTLHAESVVLTITIPDDLVLLTPVVKLSQKTSWGNLMLDISQRGNLITIERGFESVEKVIDVKEYEALREMSNRWNNELYQRLVFRKKQ